MLVTRSGYPVNRGMSSRSSPSRLLAFMLCILLAVPLYSVPPVAAAPDNAVFGTVRDADTGQPLSGAQLWVESDTEWAHIETGEDGSYSIDLPAGEYSVYVWCARYLSVLAPNTVFDGENPVDFALEKSVAIFGTVTDAQTGDPIQGAWVEAMDHSIGEKLDWMTTDEDGYYELHGYAGEYGVYVGTQGYLSGRVEDVVFDGENPVEINFQLEKQLAIFGTVTDVVTGEPIDAHVYANNGASASARTSSEDGYYELHLPAGEYEMRVDRVGVPGSAAHVDSVVFDGENPVEINFQLEKQLAILNIEGTTRFHTAVAASLEAYPAGADYVIIATGRNWPDALGGTALAGALDAPILLVEPTSLPAVAATEISRLGATHAIILGGTGAVSDAVRAQIDALPMITNVERIAGTTRYQTADAVALRTISVLGGSFDGTVFVATGGNFPDALAAAPLAAAQGWPLILAHPTGGLSAASATLIGTHATRALILGGTGAVSPAVESSLNTLLGGAANTERLQGITRYATAVAIADYAVDEAQHTWDRVGIATGEDYPDALAGGVLQGKVASVMLLTTPTSLHPDTATALETNAGAIDTVTFFGGTGAVSNAVRTAVLGLVD